MRQKRETMKLTLALLFSALLVANGCGGPFDLAKAQPLVSGCDPLNPGACHGHEDFPWGYCQWETHQGPHTFNLWLEIGVASGNVTGRCKMPLGLGGGEITSLAGTLNYLPQTLNRSSMVVGVWTEDEQNFLYAGKIATDHGYAVTVPINASGLSARTPSLTVIFNDDLAKPVAINLGFAGTLK
jgi:hypothetical protein